MQNSLEQLAMRLEELDRSLMDPAVMGDSKRLREVTKERAHLEPIVQLWNRLTEARQELEEAKELTQDPEMAEMAREEISMLNEKSQNWSRAAVGIDSSRSIRRRRHHLGDSRWNRWG